MYDDLMDWWRRFLCVVFGHKQPYVQKFTAELCRRCSRVMVDHTPVKYTYNTKILELKRRNSRVKRRKL